MNAVSRVMESDFIQYRSLMWIVTAGIPEDANRLSLALDAVARRHVYVSLNS